jgi:hypothetical protein
MAPTNPMLRAAKALAEVSDIYNLRFSRRTDIHLHPTFSISCPVTGKRIKIKKKQENRY